LVSATSPTKNPISQTKSPMSS